MSALSVLDRQKPHREGVPCLLARWNGAVLYDEFDAKLGPHSEAAQAVISHATEADLHIRVFAIDRNGHPYELLHSAGCYCGSTVGGLLGNKLRSLAAAAGMI